MEYGKERWSIGDMEKAYQDDAEFVEKNSGPGDAYSLVRDVCVPLFCLKILGKTKFENVLDVGIATGSLSRVLASFSNSVDGIDATAGAITIAKQRGAVQTNLSVWQENIFDSQLKPIYDFIHVREFHPLTRDLYDSDREKRAAHKHVIETLVKGLSPDGWIYIAHVTSKDQCIRAGDIADITGVTRVLCGIDGRVIFLLAPLFGYRRLVLCVAKALSWPIKKFARRRFFEVILLKKTPA